MSAPFTGPDALGVYLSGDKATSTAYGPSAALGGSRLAVEVAPLSFRVENAIPTLIIDCVSGACGVGIGYLQLTGINTVRFKAPGEAQGEAVTVPANGTVLVHSASADKYVRVTREGTAALTQPNPVGMKLTLVPAYNGVVAHDNALDVASPRVTYRAVYIVNRTAHALASIAISGSAGMAFGLQAVGSDGTVNAIASETTAPSGVTFASTQSLASLSPDAGIVLWIRRTIPVGATITPAAQATVSIAWTGEAVAHSTTLYGAYGVGSSAQARYEVEVNGSTAATSTTLPAPTTVSKPATGTTTHNIAVRRRNAYGLASLNVYQHPVTINTAGNPVTSPISVPRDVALTAVEGGCLAVSAVYVSASDPSPADTWLVYVRTDGTDPDPATDTPLVIPMQDNEAGIASIDWGRAGMWGSSNKLLYRRLGPYEWGSAVRVLVRTQRASDSAASTNTTSVSTSVSTVPAIPVNHAEAILGYAYGTKPAAQTRNTTTYSAQYNVRIVRCPGEAALWIGNDCVWRATVTAQGDALLRIDPAYYLYVDSAGLGAGTGALEVVSGPVVYINVGGTRRLKIDAATKRITAAAVNLGTSTLTDCPSTSPVARLAAETLLTVWSPQAGRYVAYASVSNDGTLSIASPAALTGVA